MQIDQNKQEQQGNDRTAEVEKVVQLIEKTRVKRHNRRLVRGFGSVRVDIGSGEKITLTAPSFSVNGSVLSEYKKTRAATNALVMQAVKDINSWLEYSNAQLALQGSTLVLQRYCCDTQLLLSVRPWHQEIEGFLAWLDAGEKPRNSQELHACEVPQHQSAEPLKSSQSIAQSSNLEQPLHKTEPFHHSLLEERPIFLKRRLASRLMCCQSCRNPLGDIKNLSKKSKKHAKRITKLEKIIKKKS